MRPRTIPVIRPRPPRFLGLHADAGSGRGRRTPDDAAGAAALQNLCRANLQRTPFRADRRGRDQNAEGKKGAADETEPSLPPPRPPNPPASRRPTPPPP